MQYRLSTLLIVMALFCVYFGILNMPTFIAVFLFFAVVLVSPAYWVTGLIFARNERRAFFIGGIAAGTIPFLILGCFGVVMVTDGPWRWGFNRYEFGETQVVNMMLSVFISAPVLLAFAGAWVGKRVYRNLQTTVDDTNPAVHAQPIVKRPHPLDRDVEPVNS
jgi:MFS family permease